MGVRHLTDELRPAIAQGPATAAEFADAVRPHMPAMTRLAARLGPNEGQDDVVPCPPSRLGMAFVCEWFATFPLAIPEHIEALIATVRTPTGLEPSACEPEAFLEATRVVLVDYDPIESPRNLAKLSDLVVIGRVIGGTAGPGALIGVPDDLHVMGTHLTIAVREVVRGDPMLVRNGQILVSMFGNASTQEAIHSIAGCDVFLFLSSIFEAVPNLILVGGASE